MARPKRTDVNLVKQARQVARQTGDLDEYKQALAISLPADLGMTLEQTGQTLGVSRATVHRLQTRFSNHRREGTMQRKSSWGGRRRALLSVEEERDRRVGKECRSRWSPYH